MNIEEFKSRALRGVPESLHNTMIEMFATDKVLRIESGLASAFDFAVKLDDSHSKLAAQIEKIYLDAGVLVQGREEMLKGISDKNKGRITDSLIERGVLVMVDKQMLFHRTVFDGCIDKMRDFVNRNGEITLAQFRDLIGASRKYAIEILEYCDAKKITKKTGDARIMVEQDAK